MKPAKIYQFTVPANGSFPLLVTGTVFKILSSTAAIIVAGDRFGTLGSLLAGQGLRDAPFDRLTFTDASGANNLVTLLIADAGFVDDRITGEVSVIDGGKARTMANSSFCGVVAQAALAANYSYAQLFNPAASGKNLFVGQVGAQTGTAAGMIVGFQNATTGALTGTNPASKKANGAAGVGLHYAGTSGVALAGLYSLINGNIWVPKEPLMVPPGWSIFLRGGVLNQDVQAAFEFFEEAV